MFRGMARKRTPKKTASPPPSPSAAPKRARKKAAPAGPLINVRHMTRRDIGDAWEFLKISFRAVNAETVEYQRPISRRRFEEVFEEEGIEQLLFEVDGEIVAYAECSYEVTGSDNWINPRYFEKRDMRPLFVDELAVHPSWNGKGVGSFVLEQLHHLARVPRLHHLVLEVAQNTHPALNWYTEARLQEARRRDLHGMPGRDRAGAAAAARAAVGYGAHGYGCRSPLGVALLRAGGGDVAALR